MEETSQPHPGSRASQQIWDFWFGRGISLAPYQHAEHLPHPPLGNLGFSTKDLHVLREIFSTRLLQCVLRAFLPNDRKQPKQFRSWQTEGRDLGGFFIKKKPPFNTLKESTSVPKLL
jgi:hypothetical protein